MSKHPYKTMTLVTLSHPTDHDHPPLSMPALHVPTQPKTKKHTLRPWHGLTRVFICVPRPEGSDASVPECVTWSNRPSTGLRVSCKVVRTQHSRHAV